MTTLAVEMTIEPGAERLVTDMGRRMKTKARSKVIDRTLTQIRDDFHISELTDWFREDAFAVQRRTTVRLSPENADFVAALAQTVGKGRPSVLMGLIYFAAAHLSRDDLESLRT
ncbi:hypothetical protein ACJ3XI_10115 [Litorimonas sp. RW-G-Af-16]|uniref:hypothetical protein n=1 Tax=Litorimonas sp. RW-G-Af-16 TaxID=3241168 RepID=UPI00390C74C0